MTELYNKEVENMAISILGMLEAYKKSLDEEFKDICKGRECNTCDALIYPDGCKDME